MRLTGSLLSLCVCLASCSRSEPTSPPSVAPSQLGERALPALVSIRGAGLAQHVSLSLDNAAPVQPNELQVAFGETPMRVTSRNGTDEVWVSVGTLEPGIYDLHITRPGGATTSVPAAFRVLAATDAVDGSSAGTATSGADSFTLDESFNATGGSSAGVGSTGAISSQTHPESDGNSLSEVSTSSASDTSSSTPNTTACVASSRLFADDFESGTFDAWTSNDLSGSCHTSALSRAAGSVSGSYAFHSDIECARNSDHENYGGLQFDGDTVLQNHVDSGRGIDAPYGVMIRFWARVEYSFQINSGRWIALVLLSGSCNWSDTVFSIGTGNTSAALGISHDTVNGGTSTPFVDAPTFPQSTWVQVSAYVNYHTQTFVVWQDGLPVTRADFVRPGTTLCHIRIGAYVSANTSDAQVSVDDPEVWRLDAPLDTFDEEPCLAAGNQ